MTPTPANFTEWSDYTLMGVIVETQDDAIRHAASVELKRRQVGTDVVADLEVFRLTKMMEEG